MSPWIHPCALLLSLALCLPCGAATGDYRFTPLVPRAALASSPLIGVPAVAEDGTAAVSATLRRIGEAVFTAPASGSTRLVATEKRFSRFGDLAINASGQVAFEASLQRVNAEGIFRGDGQAVVQIAGTRQAGDFDFVRSGPSINASGRVAFSGERIVGDAFIDGVYTGEGGSVQAVYDTTGLFRDFSGNPAINDRGEVAFLATLRDGVGGLFLGTGEQAPLRLADDSGPLTGIVGFSDPALNNRGEVAFSAGTNPDFGDNGASTGGGVFLYSQGALKTIVQGGFDVYFSLGEPALNNAGQLAFLVEPSFGNQILVTGARLVQDRVIGSGDRLGHRVVRGIAFGRGGLNDAGELVFLAFFEDGSYAPYRATPVTRP